MKFRKHLEEKVLGMEQTAILKEFQIYVRMLKKERLNCI